MSRQGEDSRAADALWAQYARTHDPHTREALVHQFERLAYSIANRFARPGTENEDLEQVALLGLVKAVDRFDPSTRYRFATFAAPTIVGEIRRYFRDQSWNVHVPRGLQETAQQVNRAQRHLTECLGRLPTAADIAAHLELPEERVLEALALRQTRHVLSLDTELETRDSDRPAMDRSLGVEDPRLANAADRMGVRQAIRHLSQPLQRIIRLRYLCDMSQRQVARELGLSPMQVSRMEKRALSELRKQLALN
jgi:RNA polymerase sigma-B factor